MEEAKLDSPRLQHLEERGENCISGTRLHFVEQDVAISEGQAAEIVHQSTRADAARGLTDIRRLGELLVRVRGKIDVRELDRVSPLAVPILLEIGRESVQGGALTTLLEEAEEDLISEAMGGDMQGALPI